MRFQFSEYLLALQFRKRLFGMINELPTIFEVVTGAAKKLKEKSSASNYSSSKSKSNSKEVQTSILVQLKDYMHYMIFRESERVTRVLFIQESNSNTPPFLLVR